MEQEGQSLSESDFPELDAFGDEERTDVIERGNFGAVLSANFTAQARWLSARDVRDIPLSKEVVGRCKNVGIGKSDIASSHEELFCIATRGLVSCLGIALYDRERGVAGIAHVRLPLLKVVIEFLVNGGPKPDKPAAMFKPNPHFHDPVAPSLEDLVRRSDKRGGTRYKARFFNVDRGCRTRTQNRELKDVIRGLTDRHLSTGKIEEVEFSDELGFVYDTRRGIFVPYQ